MSGYQPRSLLLANVRGPVVPIADCVLSYITATHRRKPFTDDHYLIDDMNREAVTMDIDWESIEDPSPETIEDATSAGYAVRVGQEIRVGKWDFIARLFFVPVPDGLSVCMKMESAVFDSVYCHGDDFESVDDEQKAGVIELCTGLTAAAGSEGFLFETDEYNLRPLSADQIEAELRETVMHSWDVGGISHDRLTTQELTKIKTGKSAPSHRIYSSALGLTLYDFLHVRKY